MQLRLFAVNLVVRLYTRNLQRFARFRWRSTKRIQYTSWSIADGGTFFNIVSLSPNRLLIVGSMPWIYFNLLFIFLQVFCFPSSPTSVQLLASLDVYVTFCRHSIIVFVVIGPFFISDVIFWRFGIFRLLLVCFDCRHLSISPVELRFSPLPHTPTISSFRLDDASLLELLQVLFFLFFLATFFVQRFLSLFIHRQSASVHSSTSHTPPLTRRLAVPFLSMCDRGLLFLLYFFILVPV